MLPINVTLYPENEDFMAHCRSYLPYLKEIFRVTTQGAFYIDIVENSIVYYYKDEETFDYILNPLMQNDFTTLQNTSQFDQMLVSAILLPKIPDSSFRFIVEISEGDPNYAFPKIIQFFQSLSPDISFQPIDLKHQYILFESANALTNYLLYTIKKFDDILKHNPELMMIVNQAINQMKHESGLN
jgi:hypothetical protein